jgi:hypothetical protein
MGRGRERPISVQQPKNALNNHRRPIRTNVERAKQPKDFAFRAHCGTTIAQNSTSVFIGSRTDLTTLSLLIPPRLEAPPAAGLFIYRKVGTLIAYSSTRNRSISIPLVGRLAPFSAREALAQCSYLMNDAGRPHGYSDPCNCYLEITETVTLISDTPRILTFVPDTRRMKSSSPWKSGFAVYEKDGPLIATWPDCGGATSLTSLMFIGPNFNPRVQLVPLPICMAQSTASELSWKGGEAEKMHESANAGTAKSRNVAKELMPNHIVRSSKACAAQPLLDNHSIKR